MDCITIAAHLGKEVIDLKKKLSRLSEAWKSFRIPQKVLRHSSKIKHALLVRTYDSITTYYLTSKGR